MLFGKPTVHDDRGRNVPLVKYEPVAPFGADAEKWARLRRHDDMPGGRATKQEIARGIRWGLLILPMLIAVAVLPAYLAQLKLARWIVIISSMLSGLMPAVLTISFARRVTSQRMARSYARAAYCGSCGYDLQNLQEEKDGFRICPECGAAWNVTRSAP